MSESTNISEFMKVPKAKLSPKLLKIKEELRGMHRTSTTPPIFGTVYTLRTLEPWEEDVANGLVGNGTILQSGDLSRKAHLAVALVAIDGEPVAEAFAIPTEISPDAMKILKSSTVIETDWRHRQILEWLNGTQPELIDQLFAFYLGEVMTKRQELEKLRPFLKATATGGPSPT